MNKKYLEKFLYEARTKTYAGAGGEVKSVLLGSTQLEYTEEDWLYRDVYYTGKNTFAGLETIYFKDKPVFSVSYYGNWGEMTEQEIDDILRGALMANPETRSYKNVEWSKNGFEYSCAPDSFSKSIAEIGGHESITKDGMEVYRFYYAGSLL